MGDGDGRPPVEAPPGAAGKAEWLQKKLANEMKKKEVEDQAAADARQAVDADARATEEKALRDEKEQAALLREVPDTTANYWELEGKINVEEKDNGLLDRVLNLLL